MKSSQVGRPFSQPGLKERCFLLTRQNQTSPRGRHRTPRSACNSPGPLRCWRSHLRCSARLPTSFCPTGFCPEIWGRRPAWWCHRGLCSHCSSPCCPPFLLPSPPSTSPPALPPGLPAARCWVCVGEGSGGRLREVEVGRGPAPPRCATASKLRESPHRRCLLSLG